MAKKEKKGIKKVFGFSKTKKFIGCMIIAMAFVLISYSSAYAFSISWSGPVAGEDPNIFVSGNADFTITSGSQLQLVLTNTSNSLTAVGQSLSGLTWDFTGDSTSVILTRDSASLTIGSLLIAPTTLGTDLSGEWAYKDNIAAGDLGSHGVGAMGDILNGMDTFGGPDLFDQSLTARFPGPGGPDYMIVKNVADITKAGFKNGGPFVDNSVTFLWDITGSLDLDDIGNVNALFGTDGQTIVPEPATIALLGICLVGLAGAEVRRKWKKKAVDNS